MKFVYFLFHTSVALLLISCNLNHTQQNEAGNLWPLHEGPFKPIKNARLGPAVEFINGLDESTCYQLFIKNREVGWIHSAFKAKSHLVFFTCTKHEGEPFTPESILGGSDDSAIYEIQNDRGNWSFKEIETPKYNFMSNPNICGDLVAYWGNQDNVYYAIIYDFNKRIILKEIKLGAFDIATDYSGYFHYPIWDENCSKVIFPKHSDHPEDVTIELAN